MDSLVCVVCVSLIWVITAFLKTATTSGGGGGRGRRRAYWYSGFQVTGMIKWGQKEKEKNPWTNIPPPTPPPKKRDKIPSRDTQKLSGIFRLFWIPKRIPYVNQGTKKILEFSSQNFKPKQSFDHSRHMKSGVPLRAATYIIYQVSGGICSVEYDLKEKDAIK